MTTGMSAPPIGMMMVTPKMNATITRSQNTMALWVGTKITTSTTISAARPMLMKWRIGNRIGAPLMRPSSFRKAMTEPVKVMAPMATPSDISTRLEPWMCPGVPMPNAAGEYSAPAATSTAAMPTSEWKAATSCGILVIGTRWAITAPMPPPIAIATTTSTKPPRPCGGLSTSVVASAMPMPIMPNRLPWRDVVGLDSPRSDRMNSTAATR